MCIHNENNDRYLKSDFNQLVHWGEFLKLSLNIPKCIS